MKRSRIITFSPKAGPSRPQPRPAIVVVLPVIRIENYGRTSRRQWRGKRHRHEDKR